MTVEQIVKKFKDQPHWIKCGAGKLAKRWKCSREDIYAARNIYKNGNVNKGVKILVFDIETSPSITYTFRRFKENIGLDQVEQDPIMLTWSAKWLYSADVMSDAITPSEVLRFDDKRIVTSLWLLFDEADIVIAHYGSGFDVPMLNARAIINGLPPYTSVTQIDTKAIAAKYFKFPSNKLDALASYFGVGKKLDTDFLLWVGCLKGDQGSIDYMQKYNIDDTKILEDVYLKLRPWIKNHPNVSIYNNNEECQCHACGSTKLKQEGYYYTTVSKYETFRCECGALSRGRKTILSKDKGRATLSNIGK